MHGSARHTASRPIVVVELDMMVDPLVVWRGLCLCEGLESGWIVRARVTSHGADFETDLPRQQDPEVAIFTRPSGARQVYARFSNSNRLDW